jgi:hypothetical protein
MYGRADGMPSFQLTVAVCAYLLDSRFYDPQPRWPHLANAETIEGLTPATSKGFSTMFYIFCQQYSVRGQIFVHTVQSLRG